MGAAHLLYLAVVCEIAEAEARGDRPRAIAAELAALAVAQKTRLRRGVE
jgi:hypothetical protein